jgi:hypothetical protein
MTNTLKTTAGHPNAASSANGDKNDDADTVVIETLLS